MRTGVYVHVPFCEQRCYYCAFTVSLSGKPAYEPYVERLIREIELSEFKDGPPDSIFFGGGTPSIIDGGSIARILAALPHENAEISLEANPGTLTAAKLAHYRAAGVNRISLGAQSFSDEDLKNAGRLHSAEDVFSDIGSLRAGGFSNINIDLIAGLPRQRLEIWNRNLDWIDRLRPEHVSIYMLDAEERSAWGKQPSDFPDDDVFATFYLEAAARLSRAGYVHYEISNWALPGFECRHNLKYWTGVPYRGFGVSGHSFTGTHRFWNTASLADYARSLDSGRLPIAGEEALSKEMRLEEAFMLGLRQIRGFDVWAVAAELHLEYPPEWFERVCELEDAGLVRFDGKVLSLAPAGWLLANGVTEELLWPTLLSISEATP